jgi:mannosyltransferase
MLLRGVRGLRSLVRLLFYIFFSRQAIPLWLIFFAASAEVYMHSQRITVVRPERNLDEPFATGCQNVTFNAAQQRENGVLVMLVRNSDLDDALHTVLKIERHFNKWFGYPYVFLNNEPWTDKFMTVMNATVSSEASFEVLPAGTWGFPDHIDKELAMASIAEQGSHGQWSKANKAGIESYHHMCRFFSG